MGEISVIGAGAWGSALAQAMSESNDRVTLWAFEPELSDIINTRHENSLYLPDIPLSPKIVATGNIEEALKNDIILLVTPAQVVRQTLRAMRDFIRPAHSIIICSKGIEIESGQLLSDVAAQETPSASIAVLTGPNFAIEIARGKPAATTLACSNLELAETLQSAISSPHFRPYISDDIIGAQIAGSLKNVIAIACGIAHGLEMGESARASLVTRGLAEIARLGVAMGGKKDTFLGLCGVGDMMLTCSSEKSRNFSLGSALGRGETLEQILGARNSVTEGVHTAKAAVALAEKHNIEMPISLAVHRCLNEGLPLSEALDNMLNRPLGRES